MDPKLKEMFDALREELKKNGEAVRTITAIEQRVASGETSLTKAQDEIKTLRETVETVNRAIEDLKKEGRKAALARDGVTDKTLARAVLGMQVRALFFQHIGQPLPREFATEREALEQHRATLNAGATGGSYLVPTIVEAEIMEAVEAVSPLVAACDFQPGLPGKVDLPTLTGRPALQAKRATVDTAMTQSDPTIGRVQFSPEEAYVYFPIDNRLMQMSAVQLGAWAQNLTRDAILDGLANWVLNADGSSTYNSITGLLNETTAAYVSALPSGKTAFSDLTKGDLTAAKAKALLRAQNIGTWLMGAYIVGLVEDLDRTGKIPVITGGDGSGVRRILGNEVLVDAYMPGSAASAAGTAFAVFGDLKTVLVGLVGGIQLGVSTEFLFNKNQTAFRGVINADIKRKAYAGLITLKTAAS
jgi:HK97 family phage major capsid protein